MYKQSFKLFVIFCIFLFTSISCQTPNVKEPKKEDKPQVIITDKKKELKSFSTKTITISHIEKYSAQTDFSFKYDREVYDRTSVIHLLQTGGADPNFYLLNENTSTYKENASGFIKYVPEEKKWKVGLFGIYFDLPDKGGSYTYTSPSEEGGYYTQTFTFTLSISDSEITIKISGNSVLSPSYSTGPYFYAEPFYCQGVDFSIHTGFCYNHYSTIQTDKYDSTVILPIKTSVLTLSVNPTEINDTNASSEIKVSSSDDEPWQLEITKEGDETPDCKYEKFTKGDQGNATLPFTSTSQGTYNIKVYYVNYPDPDKVETAKLKVNNDFDLSINPETVLVVGQKASLKIKAKNRSWLLETKEPSVSFPIPDPSASPPTTITTKENKNGDLTIEKTFDKVGDYTFTLTPTSCSKGAITITKTVKVVVAAPPLPSDNPSVNPSVGSSIDPSGNPSVNPSNSVPPIDISISPSSGSTPDPDPDPAPNPQPTPTVTPTPKPTPSVLGEGDSCDLNVSELQTLEDRGLITYL